MILKKRPYQEEPRKYRYKLRQCGVILHDRNSSNLANANLYKIFLKKNFKTMDVTIGGVSLIQAIFVFIMWVGYNATRG